MIIRWLAQSFAPTKVTAVREPIRPLNVPGVPTWSGAIYQASVGNGRYPGAGLTVAEHAEIDDGNLHVYVVLPGTFWQLLACITHLGSASPSQRAICDAMEDILTTLDDGSEAATGCSLIAHRIFDYQDAFKAKHGYMPLDRGPIEQVSGPVGRAWTRAMNPLRATSAKTVQVTCRNAPWVYMR